MVVIYSMLGLVYPSNSERYMLMIRRDSMTIYSWIACQK